LGRVGHNGIAGDISNVVNFLIADTFTGSLARLSGDEQKAVKTTAFDLQLNPANPGMQFHRLDKSRDPNFWSVRAGSVDQSVCRADPLPCGCPL
jgi:ABC-type cobalamin transport system ATPase subunit